MQHGPYVLRTNWNLLGRLVRANWKKLSVCLLSIRRKPGPVCVCVEVGLGWRSGTWSSLPSACHPGLVSTLMVWSMSVLRRADSLGRGNHLKEEESFREDLWDAFISLKCVQQTGFDWQRHLSSAVQAAGAASALSRWFGFSPPPHADPLTLTRPDDFWEVRRRCWFGVGGSVNWNSLSVFCWILRNKKECSQNRSLVFFVNEPKH